MQLSDDILDKIGSIPDKPMGFDRIVSLIVIDRPDPEGPDDGAVLNAMGATIVNTICTGYGTTPDNVRIVSDVSDVETTDTVTPVLTGEDILASAPPGAGEGDGGTPPPSQDEVDQGATPDA